MSAPISCLNTCLINSRRMKNMNEKRKEEMPKPNYKLYVIVERFDGSLFKQWVCTLTEEQSKDFKEIQLRIRNYMRELGHGYYCCDWFLEYR